MFALSSIDRLFVLKACGCELRLSVALNNLRSIIFNRLCTLRLGLSQLCLFHLLHGIFLGLLYFQNIIYLLSFKLFSIIGRSNVISVLRELQIGHNVCLRRLIRELLVA